ncbi:MAG: sigma 54-interacting transcriptional regulator [Treponema sp.]|nr:sigma 54-interacting transcriptional regulator [Treponema sp.]
MSDVPAISTEQLKKLIEINMRINSSYSDPNTLVVYVLESARVLAKCEAASLFLVNPGEETLRFVVELGADGAEAKRTVVSGNSIAGWVVKHGQPLIVDDVSKDVRFSSFVQENSRHIARNVLAVPLQVKNSCLGAIEMVNRLDGGRFGRTDLDVLSLLGLQFGIALQNARAYKTARERIGALQSVVYAGGGYHPFVAKSPVVIDLLRVIDEVAKTNSSVLISGESGTGKEVFAEQLHLKSPRSGKQFVRVNCATLSPALLERRLFGHGDSAGADSASNYKSLFETADGGTIFFDEIGELPLELQAKLLRVIKERMFERTGSQEMVPVDVRVVASTSRNLETMVGDGMFLGDLYYRLNVLPLNIPPLRQRKEDIQPLAEFFLDKFSGSTKKNFEGLSPAALDVLYRYMWPGNVRELENAVERACILGRPPFIEANDFRLNAVPGFSEAQPLAKNTVSEVVSGEDRTLKTAVNTFKKAYVTQVLEQNRWNQTATAKVLDVQRTYVSKLLNELEIHRPSNSPAQASSV